MKNVIKYNEYKPIVYHYECIYATERMFKILIYHFTVNTEFLVMVNSVVKLKFRNWY